MKKLSITFVFNSIKSDKNCALIKVIFTSGDFKTIMYLNLFIYLKNIQIRLAILKQIFYFTHSTQVISETIHYVYVCVRL